MRLVSCSDRVYYYDPETVRLVNVYVEQAQKLPSASLGTPAAERYERGKNLEPSAILRSIVILYQSLARINAQKTLRVHIRY